MYFDLLKAVLYFVYLYEGVKQLIQLFLKYSLTFAPEFQATSVAHLSVLSGRFWSHSFFNVVYRAGTDVQKTVQSVDRSRQGRGSTTLF